MPPWILALRVKGACEDRIDLGLTFVQSPADLAVHCFKGMPIVVASADTSLISDDNYGNTLPIRITYSLRRTFDQHDRLGLAKIISFLDDHTVTIEE